MKKQIKKLVKKTYLFDDYETVADRQQKIYSFTEEGLEKLAELIVRECAHVALMSNGNNLHVCELIKQHFGVEE